MTFVCKAEATSLCQYRVGSLSISVAHNEVRVLFRIEYLSSVIGKDPVVISS